METDKDQEHFTSSSLLLLASFLASFLFESSESLLALMVMAHAFSLQFSHSVIISLPQKLLEARSKSTRLISTVRCSNIKIINGADDSNHYGLNTYYNQATSNYQWDLTESWDASAAGGLLKTLKENGNEYTWGDVTVKLAEAYRFCCGNEPTVQIASYLLFTCSFNYYKDHVL